MTERKTIAVDLDGVIHSYTSRWQGAANLPDPPVPGAFEFIEECLKVFDVVIFTTRLSADICDFDGSARHDVVAAIREWFNKHGLPSHVVNQLSFSSTKPKAIVYIDDRGFRFEGTWPTVEELKALKPWWQL